MPHAMFAVRLLSFLLVALVPLAAVWAQQGRAPVPQGRSVTQVTIQQRMIVRIPRLPVERTAMPAMSTAPLPPIRWVEKKTDKCVPVENLAAASIATTDSVDLLLNGGKRLRARFGNDCRALDFYSGFYVKLNGDGKMCADRDSIRSRSGGECRIESLRALVPSR